MVFKDSWEGRENPGPALLRIRGLEWETSPLAPLVRLEIWPAQGGRVRVVVPTLTKQLPPAGSTQEMTTVTRTAQL